MAFSYVILARHSHLPHATRLFARDPDSFRKYTGVRGRSSTSYFRRRLRFNRCFCHHSLVERTSETSSHHSSATVMLRSACPCAVFLRISHPGMNGYAKAWTICIPFTLEGPNLKRSTSPKHAPPWSTLSLINSCVKRRQTVNHMHSLRRTFEIHCCSLLLFGICTAIWLSAQALSNPAASASYKPVQ